MQEQQHEKKKWKKTKIFSLIGFIFFFYYLINFTLSSVLPKPKLEISPDTVYIDDPPMNKYGTVDYIGWLNEQCSKGVTPEQNIMVALGEILGPNILFDPENRKQITKKLGIKGNGIFTTLEKYKLDHKIKDSFLMDHLLESHDSSGRLWLPEDSPETATFLKDNQAALNATVAASNRTHYYWPLITEKEMVVDVELPELSKVRELTKALATRSSMLIAQGKLDDALRDILAIRKIGLLLKSTKEKPITLIEQLVSLTIKNLANKHAMILLANDSLTASEAQHFLEQWQALPSPLLDIQSTMLFERLMMLDCVMAVYDGRGNEAANNPEITKSKLDVNLMARRVNDLNNKMIHQLQYGGDVYNRECRKVENNTKPNSFLLGGLMWIAPEPIRIKIFTNTVMNLLMSILTPSFNKVPSLFKAEQTNYDLVEIGLALRCYNFKYGNYPEKLAQLSPEFLKVIPNDPLADAPYNYKRTAGGFILYGVGKDFSDNGGRKYQTDDYAGNLDLVVEVPFKNPPLPKKKPERKTRSRRRRSHRKTSTSQPAATQPKATQPAVKE